MKVPLKPGTKVLISGHPATLTDDYQFDFTELPTVQAIGESLRNDSHNFGLNQHLHVEPESQALEPWIFYDEETETVSALGYKTESFPLEDDTQTPALVEPPTEPKQQVETKPAPKKKAVKKPAKKKVSSKPVSGKAAKKAKKGKKR